MYVLESAASAVAKSSKKFTKNYVEENRGMYR